MPEGHADNALEEFKNATSFQHCMLIVGLSFGEPDLPRQP